MFKFQVFALLLCVSYGLTSPVTNRETDGSSESNHLDLVKYYHDPGGTSALSIKMQKLNDNTHGAGIMGEGGLIYNESMAGSVKTLPSGVVTKRIKLTSDDLLDTNTKLPKTRNASIVPKKGAVSSKISARKGVSLESLTSTDSTVEGIDEAIAIPQRNNFLKATHEAKNASSASVERKPLVILKSNATDATSPVPIAFTSATSIRNVTATSMIMPPKNFKPKPTVTIGEMDIDKPIPASPTKTPPLGMPRKIDYIVPVIITIMALPLLGGAAFFLYRRGRDCWEKRHYRRMDFLIDGMYNDHSWK